MSLLKFSSTSDSDKDKEEEKQTRHREETKQKYEKEKPKTLFSSQNGKMILNGWGLNIKHVQQLLFSSTGRRPASLCHGPSSVSPSVRPSVR